LPEIALKHIKSNIIGHSAFREVPLKKVVMGLGAIAGGGVALAEVLKGDGPKDVLSVITAVVKGVGKIAKSDITAVGAAGTFMETAIQQHMPSIGKLVAKSAASTVTSSIGEPCLCCVAHLP